MYVKHIDERGGIYFLSQLLIWLEARRLGLMQTGVLLDTDRTWYVVDISDVSENI